jgi:hypothetical protein
MYCGARLIQRIKRMPGRTNAELSQRMTKVLNDWIAAGHSESEIRALVAGPMAVAPIGRDVASESVPLKSGKHRLVRTSGNTFSEAT